MEAQDDEIPTLVDEGLLFNSVNSSTGAIPVTVGVLFDLLEPEIDMLGRFSLDFWEVERVLCSITYCVNRMASVLL